MIQQLRVMKLLKKKQNQLQQTLMKKWHLQNKNVQNFNSVFINYH